MSHRKLLTVLLSVLLSWPSFAARVGDANLDVSPIPRLKHHTAALDASLRALRARLLGEANGCLEDAKGMDSTGQYHAAINKTIETPSIVGFEVKGDYQCDGVHPGVYEYGISYRIKDGKRFDLNEVYAIGQREAGHLFLTKQSVGPVLAHLKQAASDYPDCLQMLDADDVMGQAFTPAVLPDGTLRLYFNVPYVMAACFDTVELTAQELEPFKDKKKAAEYGLP
jgi:hypothetical protein